MNLTDAQSAALRKLSERLNVGLQDMLALGDEVLALLLDTNAVSIHGLLSDQWFDHEGEPEFEFPFYTAEVRPHPRTKEPFAVAGSYATKVNTLEADTDELRAVDFRSTPLLIGGRAVLESCSSVLVLGQHRPRRNMPDGPVVKYLTFQRRGWLRTAELDMPAEEVDRRIAEDYDSGRVTLLPQRG